MENEIVKQLNDIERKYQRLKLLFTGFVILISLSIITVGFVKTDHFELIRTRGIVIEDENGKDRILIGAPIPHSKDRVRTDTNLVRKYFASDIHPKNPNQYMEWYKNYRHSAFGMVVMNEKGMDVMQIGDQLSDPNVGRRIFLPTGILLNNQNGLEVAGLGAHTFEDGTGGVALGLDDPTTGREALHAVVLSDGTRALILQDKNGKLLVGFGKPNGGFFKNKDTSTFIGVKYFDKKDSLVWEQKMNKPNKSIK